MLIKENDASAKSLYNSLATGCGIPAAADILNLSRKTKNLPAISFGAISHFCSKSNIISKGTRKTKKSGKSDAESNWAKARVVQSDQMLKQLGKRDRTDEEINANSITPMVEHGIVFWDEKHTEQVSLSTCI